MKRTILLAALALCTATLGGCYVYDPYYPYGYGVPGAPASYDRSWSAASGAMRDQGLEITREDRTAGMIEGRRGNIVVQTRVMAQPDGRVRVEFNHNAAITEDPGLPDRISRSYEVRMGRG